MSYYRFEYSASLFVRIVAFLYEWDLGGEVPQAVRLCLGSKVLFSGFSLGSYLVGRGVFGWLGFELERERDI